MWTLMQEGGYPMWFLMLFSVALLAAAARYAWRPSGARLRVCGGLAATTLFSALSGVASDLAAVGHHAPDYLRAHAATTLGEVTLLGVAESMSPAIVGLSALTMAALLVSFGLGRSAVAPSF